MFIYKKFVPGEHDFTRTNFIFVKNAEDIGLEKTTKS
jgi:hypothetical protein